MDDSSTGQQPLPPEDLDQAHRDGLEVQERSTEFSDSQHAVASEDRRRQQSWVDAMHRARRRHSS